MSTNVALMQNYRIERFSLKMTKHVSFWIGVFSSTLIIVPVALGVWGAAEGFARDVAVFLFGATVVLVAVLVLFLFFREAILRSILGRGEVAIEELSGSLIGAVSAATVGDRANAAKEADKFVRIFVGWYSWTNFYRWVIGSALGLLLAFGAFTGTVLLFEQTRLLADQGSALQEQTVSLRLQSEQMFEQSRQVSIQNELSQVALVAELRRQIIDASEEILVSEALASYFGWDVVDELATSEDQSCKLQVSPDAKVVRPPPTSVLSAIADLAGPDRQLRQDISRAMNLLLSDRSNVVSFSAYLVLQEIGEAPESQSFTFEGLYVDNPLDSAAEVIRFDGSYIDTANCVRCSAIASASIVIGTSKVTGWAANSFSIVGPLTNFEMRGKNLMALVSESGLPERSMPLMSQIWDEWQFWIAGAPRYTSDCHLMRDISRDNPFLEYSSTN